MVYVHRPTEIEAVEVKKNNLNEIMDFAGDNVMVSYSKDRKGNVTYTVVQVDNITLKVFPGSYLIKNEDGISFTVMKDGDFEYNYMEKE